MDNPQGTITDLELGWLAGIIDGEGTIAFSVYSRDDSKPEWVRVKPQVLVTGTEKLVIERAVELMRKLGAGAHFQTREQRDPRGFQSADRYKPLHVATAAGFKRSAAILRVIIPHLFSVKRQKAEMVLSYIDQRLAKTAVDHKAPHDREDLALVVSIVKFSIENSSKGPKSKHLKWLNGLLNEQEQRATSGAKMCSELMREHEKPAEMTGSPAGP